MTQQNVRNNIRKKQNPSDVKRYLVEHYKKSANQKVNIPPYHGYRKLYAKHVSK